MFQFRLTCNYKKCRKPLLQSAYVTTCSHVFCNEHGLNITMAEELTCPVCDTHFQTIQDIIRVNLNPDEDTKTLMLAGLSPELIMDVATRALTFWEFQLSEENLYLEANLKTAENNVAVLSAYSDDIYAKYKNEIQTLEHKIEFLNQELETNKKRCQGLIQQLQEQTKTISKLQLNIMKNGSSDPMVATDSEIFKNDFEKNDATVTLTSSNFILHTPKREQLPNFKGFPKNAPRNFNVYQNYTPRNQFKLKSIRRHKSPNYLTSSFAKNVEPDTFPPMHPFHHENVNDNQEFNFQPNLNFSSDEEMLKNSHHDHSYEGKSPNFLNF